MKTKEREKNTKCIYNFCCANIQAAAADREDIRSLYDGIRKAIGPVKC